MNNSVKNTVSRRKFLQYSGLTGAALILGVSGNHASGATTVTNLSNLDEGYNLSPYVIIEKSG
jgi:anaerobic selenocysteine-containing dehydrogenase